MKTEPIPTRIQLRRFNRIHGFTLVELLVVIVIIAVLAALTFSLTRKFKAKSYQANALSSLRQVAAFNIAYSTENNGDINTLRYAGDPKEGTPWVSSTYWGRLQPYLFPDAASSNQGQLGRNLNQRMDQLFNTKDSDKMLNTALGGSRIYHDTSGLPVPFAFNANLAPWGKFAKTSIFSDSSKILYLAYGFAMFNEDDGKTYEPMPLNGAPVKNNIYFLEDRKAMVAYLDGHVDLVQAPIPAWKFK